MTNNDDEIQNMPRWVIPVSLFIFGLVIGLSINFGSKWIAPPNLVEELDIAINDFPPIKSNSAFSDMMTIKELRNNYFKYKPMSSDIMVRIVKDICQKGDWSVAEYNLKTTKEVLTESCNYWCKGVE